MAERWPPGLMRAWFTGETYGVPMLFVAKHRNKRYNDGERKPMRGAIVGDDEIVAATASRIIFRCRSECLLTHSDS